VLVCRNGYVCVRVCDVVLAPQNTYKQTQEENLNAGVMLGCLCVVTGVLIKVSFLACFADKILQDCAWSISLCVCVCVCVYVCVCV